MKSALGTVLIVLLAATFTSPRVAYAQAYPTKPVKLIVPFTPGGGADIVARLIGTKLSEGLGQPVIVENRPGAGGMIGSELVAKSPPDGYTLLLGSPGPLTIAPHLNEKVAFDSIRDFQPIALIASSPFVLVVNPSVRADSLGQLTALAKANPGKLNLGSSGSGAVPHLAGELYKSMAGVNLVHVAYKGLGPAIIDLMGGEVQVLFADVSLVLQHIRSGKLRALAVTGAQRSAALPDVPTMMEAGLPDYRVETWYGVVAASGTPRAIVTQLNGEVRKALSMPDVVAQFATLGVTPAATTPERFGDLIREDSTKWSKLIKDAKITAD